MICIISGVWCFSQIGNMDHWIKNVFCPGQIVG